MKPGRWNIAPTAANAHFWRDLAVVFPLWEHAGDSTIAGGPKAVLFPSNTISAEAVWAEGGVNVDPDGSRVVCGTADPISEGNLTLMFVGDIKSLPGAGVYGSVITKADDWATDEDRWWWDIDEGPNNYFQWSSMPSGVITFAVGPTEGEHVWFLTDDGTNSRIYEDSALRDSDASITFGTKTTAVVRIGSNSTAEFPGIMKMVAMWSRVLTAAEIRELSSDPYLLIRHSRGLPVYPHYTASRHQLPRGL